MINRDALITQVSLNTGFTKKDIRVVLENIFETIADYVAQGEVVSITNFGKFETTTRAARKCVNPQTGEKMDIPEMIIPHFKPSVNLKELVK